VYPIAMQARRGRRIAGCRDGDSRHNCRSSNETPPGHTSSCHCISPKPPICHNRRLPPLCGCRCACRGCSPSPARRNFPSGRPPSNRFPNGCRSEQSEPPFETNAANFRFGKCVITGRASGRPSRRFDQVPRTCSRHVFTVP
jgi:hypothetical protein